MLNGGPQNGLTLNHCPEEGLILNHLCTGRWMAGDSAQEAQGAPRFFSTITMTYTEEYL